MCSRGDPPHPPTPFRKRVSVPTLRTVVRNGLSGLTDSTKRVYMVLYR